MSIIATPLSRRRLVLGTGAAAVLGLAGCRAPQSVAAPNQPHRTRLRLIGESRIAHRLQFQGTTVGGLSGIDYDAASGLYYLISDDGSSINPARFYTARIVLGMDRLGAPELLGVTTLRQANGSLYPSALQGGPVPDPEAIRWRAASNTLLWTSEGHAPNGTAPWLRETRPDGGFVREFTLPAWKLNMAGRGNSRTKLPSGRASRSQGAVFVGAWPSLVHSRVLVAARQRMASGSGTGPPCKAEG